MKRIILSLSVLMSVFMMRAETLTIEDCVRLADEHYPAVAQYGLLEKVTQFNLSNASKSWLPQGSVSVQATWQNDVAALPDALTNILSQQGVEYPGLDKLQYKAGIDINQQIWDGGKTAATRKAIETGAEMERRSLDVQLYDVQGRVEELYFALLLFDAKIGRADKSIALVDSTLQQVKSMFANGVAMQSDCDQIEAQLLSIQQQKSQLIASRDSYRRIMEIFIGQPIGNRALEMPSEESMPEAAHLQLRLFDSRSNNIKAQEAGVKASVTPQIGAFASGYYGYPGYNMFKNMQSRDLSFNFMVGVKVAWNFGALYTRKNTLDKLQIQRQQVETERETFLFNNRIAENESLGQIAGLREVMQNDERIVELRGNVVRAARSQLRNGVIDATALLTKITDEELAENDLSLHRIELIKAIYQLNHIRNK